MKNKIDNNLFGKLSTEEMSKVMSAAVPDSKILLACSRLTPSRDVVPIAEALVAYDTKKDTIVKFISAFFPADNNGEHKGIKYLIARDARGMHKAVVVKNTIEKPKDKKRHYWNPYSLGAFLDHAKLPPTVEHAEFRVLRAYRAGLRVPHRFEILNFDTPQPGTDVDKRTMRVESAWNSVPPIELAPIHRSFFWFQEEIMCRFSDFSGLDITTALGLGIERKISQAVKAGAITPMIEKEILHDHSEDPTEEVSEPLSVSLGVSLGVNMVEDEEGKPFFVPDNPMLKTMPEKEEEEEDLVSLYD